jgi:hypothetical protein
MKQRFKNSNITVEQRQERMAMAQYLKDADRAMSRALSAANRAGATTTFFDAMNKYRRAISLHAVECDFEATRIGNSLATYTTEQLAEMGVTK